MPPALLTEVEWDQYDPPEIELDAAELAQLGAILVGIGVFVFLLGAIVGGSVVAVVL